MVAVHYKDRDINGRDVEIPLEEITFPSGEVHIRFPFIEQIREKAEKHDVELCVSTKFVVGNISDEIIRLSLLLHMLEDVWLDSTYNIIVTVQLNYLPFARQDRAAYKGDVVSKQSFLEDIDTFSVVGRIEVLDMHSSKACDEIYSPLVNFIPTASLSRNEYSRAVAVQPDKGAADRVNKIVEYNTDAWLEELVVLAFNKVRDPETGKLSHFEIVEKPQPFKNPEYSEKDGVPEYLDGVPEDTPIVICDDICDGGGTFIAEAEILRKEYPKNKLILRVTHGLFTKGLESLLAVFDEVQCFNNMSGNKPSDRFKVLQSALIEE